ncbi:MAG: hypothetical protein L0Z50_08235 [Verrucomicrobiales bacterium]|nr:hypothetical protein [Verrucomicrobiales bacterium]
MEQHLKNPDTQDTPLSSIRRWSCPDEVTLAAFADGQLAHADGVENHVADCRRCRAQVAFLAQGSDFAQDADISVALLARAEALGAKGMTTAVSPAWRWATAAAVTACLVLAISLRIKDDGLDVVFPPPTPPGLDSASPRAEPPAPPQPNPPGSESQRTVRGAEASQTLPNMLQPREGAEIFGTLRFQWQPVSGSLFYEVRVTSAAGDPVWQSERVTGPEVQLPSGIQLAPGEKYFVWVVAFLPESKTVRSRAIAFTVQN